MDFSSHFFIAHICFDSRVASEKKKEREEKAGVVTGPTCNYTNYVYQNLVQVISLSPFDVCIYQHEHIWTLYITHVALGL